MVRISSIPQIYRNVRRWTEIISVLSRYGLADWLSRVNIGFVRNQMKDREGEALSRHTQEKRIRLALADLGPTFIKLGQLLSTRPDVVGIQLANELKNLRENVPPDPPVEVQATIESELGQPLEQIFAEFESEPIATASIGQVHRARLVNGDRVVVKVRRTGIEATVREDLEVLAGLAQLAERLPEFTPYRPTATVAELSRTLRRELDFGREERNLLLFAQQYESNRHLRIPRPYSELCTSKVLTMEFLEGLKLEDTDRLRASGADLDEVARRGADLYLQMIFTHGCYHADPHPGNILILPQNTIGLLDFGMIGRIEERLREDIEQMLMSIVSRDVAQLTSLIKRVGSLPPELDEGGLSNEVADFVDIYSAQPLEHFDLTGALYDMLEIIRRFHIVLPPQVVLLIKVLVTLEGTTKMLSPKFSLMEVMQPFHRKLVLRRLSPTRRLKKLRRLFSEVEQLIEVLPRRMMDILEQIRTGRFDVHLDHRGLEPSVNRLVLGLLTSALFLGSSLILSMQVPPLLFREPWYFGLEKLSILGLSGCMLSILLGLRLLRAIGKSGHLDRRQ